LGAMILAAHPSSMVIPCPCHEKRQLALIFDFGGDLSAIL